MTKPLRAIWPLLRARVIERSETHVKLSFGSEHGSPTTITVYRDMRMFDLRDGDILTIYTEVPVAPQQGEG